MEINDSVAATLRAQDHGHPPLVMVYESHNQDSRYNRLHDICETISAKYGTGGGNAPIVVKYEEDIH